MNEYAIKLLIFYCLFFLTQEQTILDFTDSQGTLDLSKEKELKFIANYDRKKSNYKYLYFFPTNKDSTLNSNKALIKIYFKQISNNDSFKNINLNYINSEYSSIDFNSGLYIRLADLNSDKAIVYINSYGTCNVILYYQYTKEINFPSYRQYNNFQLNQFILGKGQELSITHRIAHAYNDYLLILSKTSLRNIEVKVKYKNEDVTNEKMAYLYPNGYSVFLEKRILDDNYVEVYFTINNKNKEKDEILLLGYVHHVTNEIFPNEIVNGFQLYLEGNKNELKELYVSGDNDSKQYFNYQIYSKNLEIDFLTLNNQNKGTYIITEYNSMFPYKVNFEGKMKFQFYPTPQRNALYFQYIDYNENDVAQKNLQSLVTGIPKSMVIPSDKSIYHFLPKERTSDNFYYYLRPKNNEDIYVSFKECESYPDNCYFNDKKENSFEIIRNIGLWYTLPRNSNTLQLIYIYCENDCSYDILMRYEDNEPLFLFPDNDYTKFISDSDEDLFALPVFEYFETSSTQSLYIDLTVINGKADLSLRKGKDGEKLECNIIKVGNKQSCIITSGDFLKENNNYFKKEIYACVKQSNNYKNTFYNIMYGSGELDTKTLSNNIVYNELLTVPESSKETDYTQTFKFKNIGKNSYISISTQLCQSQVTIDGTKKTSAYNHFYTLSSGSHVVKIYLIRDEKECQANIEDKLTIFTYDESNQQVLLGENTLINTTLSSTASFLHLFKPNQVLNDNSFNIEIEKYDGNILNFAYELKKISFNGNSKSSGISGQKIITSKTKYISNKQINNYCGELSENEVCSLTMTFTPSSSLQFSFKLKKSNYYYAKELSDKNLFGSVNNIDKNGQYYYIDVNPELNLEILLNSYGQDLKFNYKIFKNYQEDEEILPLTTTYHTDYQYTIASSEFTKECGNSPSFCRLYIGVSSQTTSGEEVSTPFSIGYQYIKDKVSQSSINIPLNYFVQYNLKELTEVTFSALNLISSAKLIFNLDIIKEKEDDTSTVTSKVSGSGFSEFTLSPGIQNTITGSSGEININIKKSTDTEKVIFRLRVSSVGNVNIIPMISSYEEKCSEASCYYLVQDLSLDNEEKSAYFYIPESKNMEIRYKNVKYEEDFSTDGKYNSSSELMKSSNWLELPITDKEHYVILEIKKEGTLCQSFYNKPNIVTLNYGEKRTFSIRRGVEDNMKIKINKLTSGNNNKYKINLHSIMGNGIFKFQGKNYPLGLETAFKEDISIILYNDKKYDMEFEVVNQRFSSVDSDYDFVFTIEYTIETGNELQYPITFDKRNSFNFYKSGNFDTFSFYLDRKEITSADLNMNIKIYSSGNYEIKSYFADAELNIPTNKNELDGKVHNFIDGGGFTFSKLEISSEILASNESPYIYIQINAKKNSGSNVVQIDLYPYNMINTNYILARDELYVQKLPSNTQDYQLFLGKSEIHYTSDSIVNFIYPLSDNYQIAIASTDDGEKIIREDGVNFVTYNGHFDGFDKITLKNGIEKDKKYISFNIYSEKQNQNSDSFIIYYQNHKDENEAYLYNHDSDSTFKVNGKAKSVEYTVNAFKPKYSGKNIFIIKAYDKDKVEEKLKKMNDKYRSIYLLFNSDIKPEYTKYQELFVDSTSQPLKTISDTQIKSGEYYFIGVSVIIENGREQYIGYTGVVHKVESSSLWGEIADYMSEHIFASIIIIIVILFILGIMVNICRAERRSARGSSLKISELEEKALNDV